MAEREKVINLTQEELKAIVATTVDEVLIRIGIDHSNPVEMQKDFAHLRKWRGAVDTAQSTSMLTALGILTSGFLAALWLGIKSQLEK